MASILKIKDQNGNIIDIPAIKGASAYDVAVDNGFEGTEEEWLESLKGEGSGSISDEQLEKLNEAYTKAHVHLRNGSSNIDTLNKLETKITDGVYRIAFTSLPLAFYREVPTAYEDTTNIDTAISSPDTLTSKNKYLDATNLKYFYDTYVKLTDEKKAAIAEECATLIDTSLVSAIGDGVIE